MITHALLLLVGMVGLYFAYQFFQTTQSLIANGIVTTATVIENIEEYDEGKMYRPRFQFLDQQKQPVTFEGTSSTSFKAWSEGETTKVIYQPGNTSNVRIITYWNLYRTAIALTAISLPFLVMGLGYFIFHITLRDSLR